MKQLGKDYIMKNEREKACIAHVQNPLKCVIQEASMNEQRGARAVKRDFTCMIWIRNGGDL